MTLWRIYTNDLPYGWREFGLDYSREEALRVARRWRKAWPRRKYLVKPVHYEHNLATIQH